MTSLEQYIYDPNIIQVKSLLATDRAIKNNSTIDDLDLVEPSNPFNFLIENTSLVTASAVNEFSNILRKQYPYLATTKEDLYSHIDTSEINSIFAIPSNANFNIFLNKKDILKNGYFNGIYTLITIPKLSYIIIDNVYFTILNDIKIYLYPNNKLFAKYESNDLDIATQSDTLIPISNVIDSEGLEWILIDINIKQLKVYNFKESILTSELFKKTITFDDNAYYSFITVETLNKDTVSKMNLTYSTFVYDINTPTVIVNPYDNNVNLEIPLTYNLNNLVSSYLDITIYTTNGKLDMPLNNYTSSDYTLNINLPATTDPSIIGVSNINTHVTSQSFTSGGRNELTFIELKNKIINYATGDNNLPITTDEIISRLNEFDFIYKGKNKGLLESQFLVTRNLTSFNEDIPVPMDIFQHDLTIDFLKVNSSKIKQTNDYSIVIEPFQLFSLSDSELSPLTDTEKDSIKNSLTTDIGIFNNEKLYFNLYKYVLDYKDKITLRVYDVNSPTIYNNISKYNDNGTFTPIVINDRILSYNETSYIYTVHVESNSDTDLLNVDKLFGQLAIILNNGDLGYLKGIVTRSDDELIITFTLPINSYIDKNDYFTIYTEYGLFSKIDVNILTSATFVLFSIDESLSDMETSTTEDIIIDNATYKLYTETSNFEFAKKLTNIYNYYTTEYTPRKFKTYDEDVYLTYNKPVYKLDEDGLPETTVIDSDDDGIDDDVILTVLHEEGDYVLDDNGDKIIKYHKGDIILDDNNYPIIDGKLGLLHTLSLLLLEYQYLVINDDIYSFYKIDFFLKLTDTIYKDLNNINDNLLENTSVSFISNNNLNKVNIIFNNTTTSYESIITPTIDIYVADETDLIIDSYVRTLLYKILQEKLYENITISDIEKLMTESLGSEILSTRLTLNDNNIRLLNYSANSSKFIIKKRIEYNEFNKLTVIPDISINILTI